MKNKYLKAVSVIEYSLLIAVVVAALLGIQIYIKRAVCARWQQSADTFGYGRLYYAPEMRVWGH
jgi:Flp pilus assembly pilin Flp